MAKRFCYPTLYMFVAKLIILWMFSLLVFSVCVCLCVYVLSAFLLKLWGIVLKRTFKQFNSEPISTQTHSEKSKRSTEKADICLFKIQHSNGQADTAMSPYTTQTK